MHQDYGCHFRFFTLMGVLFGKEISVSLRQDYYERQAKSYQNEAEYYVKQAQGYAPLAQKR